MGQSSSSQEKNMQYVQNFIRTHQYVQDVQDSRLGQVSVYLSQTQQLIAVKNTYANTKDDLEQFFNSSMKQLEDVEHQNPFILRMVAYKFNNEDDNLCGALNHIQTYHEYYFNNLEQEVQKRAQKAKIYSEQELFSILYSYFSAVTYLDKYQKWLDDVRTRVIYITQSGQIKFQPFNMFPEDTPSHIQVVTNHERCNVAPEVLSLISKQNFNPLFNRNQADNYNMGMVLLECATLISTTECYSYDTLSFNRQNFQELLDISEKRYSKFFNNFLKLMLEENPDKRITQRQGMSILKVYEVEILNNQPFTPDVNYLKEVLSNKNANNPLIRSAQLQKQITSIDLQHREPLQLQATTSQIPQSPVQQQQFQISNLQQNPQNLQNNRNSIMSPSSSDYQQVFTPKYVQSPQQQNYQYQQYSNLPGYQLANYQPNTVDPYRQSIYKESYQTPSTKVNSPLNNKQIQQYDNLPPNYRVIATSQVPQQQISQTPLQNSIQRPSSLKDLFQKPLAQSIYAPNQYNFLQQQQQQIQPAFSPSYNQYPIQSQQQRAVQFPSNINTTGTKYMTMPAGYQQIQNRPSTYYGQPQ